MSMHVTDDWLETYNARRESERKQAKAAHDRLTKAMTGSGLSEDEEQILLFSWADYMLGTYPELALLFHIPNGGSRSRAEAGRFKAMGVKPGVPDLFLPVPRGGYSGLFIELKREHGGALSDVQRDWLDDLTARGFRAVMCHGWEAARDVLVDYLRR